MLLKYADDEMKMFKERANDGNDLAEDQDSGCLFSSCAVAPAKYPNL